MTKEGILKNIDINEMNACWEWKGTTRDGYGLVHLSDHKLVTAHRYFYETLISKIPEGKVLDHLCRNRKCVNPKHLEPVTEKENLLRGNGAPAMNSRKTHCKNGHPLSGDNLKIYKDGKRRCIQCNKNRK